MILSQNGKVSGETRGRPKKEETRTLAPIYKQLFSDNTAIVHTSFLIYVFEIFYQTKNEKRVGHKDGGFTIYDRINSEYCFEDFQQKMNTWGFKHLLQHENLKTFVHVLPAVGPQLILKQILKLLDEIVFMGSSGCTETQIYQEFVQNKSYELLDQEYPYMRFVHSALQEIKIQKSERDQKHPSIVDIIRVRVRNLWQPLLKIIVHTILNCLEGKVHNKYFKYFFSDAENPHHTYIGQLNLNQIVDTVNKQENICEEGLRVKKKFSYESRSEIFSPIDQMKKVRSVIDSDGQKQIIQIVKAPSSQKLISLTPKQKEPNNECLSFSNFTEIKVQDKKQNQNCQKKRSIESSIALALKQAFKDESEIDCDSNNSIEQEYEQGQLQEEKVENEDNEEANQSFKNISAMALQKKQQNGESD